jgi:hypothetical protein
MHAHFSATLPHAWHNIRQIRERVNSALEAVKDCSSEVRRAAVMTASELAENAIKYGENVLAAPSVAFSLAADERVVRVQVSNGCASTTSVRQLQARIDDVTKAEDKGVLYVARLEELLAHPTESGKLGIYRIAFEGKFALECIYENLVVTVIATRTYR